MPRGGKRSGAGRPISTKPRCACGKMTLKRALQMRHQCAKPQSARLVRDFDFGA